MVNYDKLDLTNIDEKIIFTKLDMEYIKKMQYC